MVGSQKDVEKREKIPFQKTEVGPGKDEDEQEGLKKVVFKT